VGVGEPGVLRRHEEVAGQRQLEPAGDRDAVDRADERLAVRWERALLLLGQHQVGGVITPGTQLLEVDPGREGGVGAGEDHHVDLGVGLEAGDGERQLALHLAVERVAGMGPVDRDGGDPVLDVDQHDIGVVGDGSHGRLQGERGWSVVEPERVLERRQEVELQVAA
jgi:hypothetical protein